MSKILSTRIEIILIFLLFEISRQTKFTVNEKLFIVFMSLYLFINIVFIYYIYMYYILHYICDIFGCFCND